MAFGLFSNERRAANERMEDDNLSVLLNSKLRINKRRRKKTVVWIHDVQHTN